MKKQMAKDIFWTCKGTMKEMLVFAEAKLGKDTDIYHYVRKTVMKLTYDSLHKIFQKMEGENLICRCECLSNLEEGYFPCEYCGGSGYKNKEAVNVVMSSVSFQ